MRDLKSGIYDIFLEEINAQLGKIQDEAVRKEKSEKAQKRLREYESQFDKEIGQAVARLMDNVVYKLKNDINQDLNLSPDKFDDILRKKILEKLYKNNK